MLLYDKQTSNTRMAQMRPGDIIVIPSNRSFLSPGNSSGVCLCLVIWGCEFDVV